MGSHIFSSYLSFTFVHKVWFKFTTFLISILKSIFTNRCFWPRYTRTWSFYHRHLNRSWSYSSFWNRNVISVFINTFFSIFNTILIYISKLHCLSWIEHHTIRDYLICLLFNYFITILSFIPSCCILCKVSHLHY